ncbi:peptidoglycan-binding protein [Streptomyces tropicalis]|uniref:Peptidoglycan-binding protein n=1 Tax=Streptomyces tropicalis TaxID=3034234 RepID=A0ABT6AEM9_9ACTN|nr:peptidoglycan-binding protein [Streptomyces tropicalis]MDF3302887.1 peptidoglycan-binding protein [Streptomyces tropicalis]
MGQWKPLSDELAPPVRRLVVRLRELKDHMGVTMTTLAAKTSYSRSSWERYLNGRSLPPRQAVEAIGRMAGTDLVRLMALWELAEHARTQARAPRAPETGSAPLPTERGASGVPEQRAGETASGPGGAEPVDAAADGPTAADADAGRDGAEAAHGPAGGDGPAPVGGSVALGGSAAAPDGRVRRGARTGVAAGGTVLAALAALAIVWWTTGAPDGCRGRAAPPRQSGAPVLPGGFPCHFARHGGLLFAGHTASEPLVVLNGAGEDVVEVQCLLRHHGHSPGRIDGLFGPLTERAVEEMQRSGGVGVDGKVGPQTWTLLRG